MKRSIENLAILVTLASGAGALAIDIPWHTVDGGATATATSASFELRASIGQPDAGLHTGGSFTLSGGYRLSASADAAPCLGDIDGDGTVDLTDLSMMLAAFGSCDGDSNFNKLADFDDSGCIELGDLAALLGVYGSACP